MKKSVIIKFAAAALLIFLMAVPFLFFPPHQPLDVSGPYAVETTSHTYTDKSRSEIYSDTGQYRQVNVVFWYPQNQDNTKTYPLVVFSHGGLGTENSNVSLYRELASHGYIVCSIGHPYHAFWTKGEDGHITFVSPEYFGEIQREDAKKDKEQSYLYYRKWMETRTADINFVINMILAESTAGTEGVYALVDSTRIGVMGHSLGGSAALAIPRQRDDIKAVIALESPFLYDIIGAENDEFVFVDQPYPVPVLNIYSDSSWSHLSEWAQYARNAELLSSPSEMVINAYLPGAGHFSLTDLSLASPLLTRMLEGAPNPDREGYLQEVSRVSLEFFDRYLKSAQ